MNPTQSGERKSNQSICPEGVVPPQSGAELGLDRATVGRHWPEGPQNTAISTTGSEANGASSNAAISTIGPETALEANAAISTAGSVPPPKPGMHGGGEPRITRVNISPRMRLAEVIKRLEGIPMGGTELRPADAVGRSQQAKRGGLRDLYGQRNVGGQHPPGTGAAAVSQRVHR